MEPSCLWRDYLRRPSLNALPQGQSQLISLVLWKLLASSTHAIAGALNTMAITGSPFMRGGGVLVPVASDLLEAGKIPQACCFALFQLFASGIFTDSDQFKGVSRQLSRDRKNTRSNSST